VPVERHRAGTGYWTPDDLGFNARFMATDTFATTPVLFCAGLNGFMLFGLAIIADPFTGQVDIETAIVEPTSEAALVARDRWTVFPFPVATPPGAPVVTFGAFGTTVPAFARGDVQWDYQITVYNVDVVNSATVTFHMLGGKR